MDPSPHIAALRRGEGHGSRESSEVKDDHHGQTGATGEVQTAIVRKDLRLFF